MSALLSSPSTLWTLTALTGIAAASILVALSRRAQDLAARSALTNVAPRAANEVAAIGIRRWWRRRHAMIAIGVFLGTTVALVYAWAVGLDRLGPFGDVLVFSAVVGASSLSVLAGTGHYRRIIEQVRVAHAEATAFADFTSMGLRVSSRLAVTSAVVLTGATMMATLRSSRYDGISSVLATPLAMTALALLALLHFEVAGRLLAHRRHRAGTPEQLAGDDTVRCLVVRDAAIAASTLGFASVALTVPKLWIVLEIQLLSPENLRVADGMATVLAVAILIGGIAVRPRVSSKLLVGSRTPDAQPARDLSLHP
ncbi:hypothetical protein ITJ42_00095 [Clavibacter michiganensis subsp. phaseoli]|uniref:Uncharacterized protein n=1 Tax=Clavibacter phaseoli TaxID=1734031 RepID=A0A8I0V7Y2_9MICO|nr:hypothetical protein [Clavibacter phaseoli]MBF4629613.1 hypothetical protein [Clavibacter phaseoli]